MKEIVTLSNGTEVECSPVSVYMAIDVANVLGIVEPEKPTKALGGIAKSTEQVPYAEDDDDPKWVEYKFALAEYEKRDGQFSRSFHWATGVTRWKPAGTKKFVNAPPKSWALPPIVDAIEMFSPELDPRRVAYIKYELLANTADANTVIEVVYGGALLSSAEVDDAVKSFQD